jgi:hypothetical protein
VPPSIENCTPDTPTPGVNGQVVGSPASQDSRSMLSLAPAARIWGLAGLTATAGSFCLFWEKMVSLLPTVTSVSGINAAAGPAASITTSDNSRPTSTARGLRRMGPPLDRQRPVLLYQTKRAMWNARYTVFPDEETGPGHQQGAGTPGCGE